MKVVFEVLKEAGETKKGKKMYIAISGNDVIRLVSKVDLTVSTEYVALVSVFPFEKGQSLTFYVFSAEEV